MNTQESGTSGIDSQHPRTYEQFAEPPSMATACFAPRGHRALRDALARPGRAQDTHTHDARLRALFERWREDAVEIGGKRAVEVAGREKGK